MNAEIKLDTAERESLAKELYKALSTPEANRKLNEVLSANKEERQGKELYKDIKSFCADVQELVLSKDRKGPAQELHDLMTDPVKYFGGGRKILNGTHRRFTIEDLRTYADDIRNIAIEEGRKRRLRYCLNEYEKKPKHRIIGKFVCREHKGQEGEPSTMS